MTSARILLHISARKRTVPFGGFVYFHDERGRPVYEQAYREMVEARIVTLLDHSVIAAIESGAAVGDDQLLDLERAMRRELGAIALNEAKIRRAYGYDADSFIAFMRYMFDLDGVPDNTEIVMRQFDEFGQIHHLNAIQTTFLRTMRKQFIRRRKLQLEDLYDPPFDRMRPDVDELFSAEQLIAIKRLKNELTIIE